MVPEGVSDAAGELVSLMREALEVQGEMQKLEEDFLKRAQPLQARLAELQERIEYVRQKGAFHSSLGPLNDPDT